MYMFVTSSTYAQVVRFEAEKDFIDPASGELRPFPTINDKPTILLTVVVPAYNEEQRC